MVTLSKPPGSTPENPSYSTVKAFTFIELLIVLAIIGLLLSLALPRYFGGLEQTEETVLRQNLQALRDSIDQFRADKGRYPDSLEELVDAKYLREIPVDPITESRASWLVLPSPDSEENGVYDVHSTAPGSTRDGQPYSEL